MICQTNVSKVNLVDATGHTGMFTGASNTQHRHHFELYILRGFMEIITGKTHRGFALGEFRDLYGKLCSIQKSSLATEDAIWLGINDAEPRILASKAEVYGVRTDEKTGWVPYPIPEEVSLNTRMHLSREQVATLLPILQRFVETGEV